MLRRTNHYAVRYNWIHENQSGFRAYHSSVDAALHLLESIKQAFKAKHGLTAVTLDLEGAYDNVDHQKLLERIPSNACPGWMADWIASFLCQRKVRAVCG